MSKENYSKSVMDLPLAPRLPSYEKKYEWRQTQSKTAYGFWIFCLMVLAAAVNWFFTIHLSLRLDESQTLWQSSHSVARMLQIVAQDVHVPLYHLILHFWQVFFGSSFVLARLVSLAFFVASIPAIFALGRQAYGPKVAMFAAILVALSPFLNWYGVEIRMYSMLVFVTILNQYFFIRLFKKETSGVWWGYFLTALVGIFTHYFFLLTLLVQFVFFFARREDFPERAGRKFALIGFVLALAFAPWLYFVYQQGFAATTQPHLSEPTTFNVFDTFSQFLFGFQTDHLDTALVSLWPVSVLLAFFALRRDRRAQRRQKVPSYSKYFLLSAILPIVVVFAVSFVKPIYLSRYLILTIPSLYLFLSWMVAQFTKDFRVVVRVGLVAAMLATFARQTVSASTPVKEDYQAAVQYLEQHASSQDAIVLSAPFTIYPVEYYYSGPAQIETLPEWDQYAQGALPVFDESKLPQEVQQVNGDFQNVWVLLSFDQGYNDKIRLFYDTHFQRIDQKDFSPGLSLWAYKLRYPPAPQPKKK